MKWILLRQPITIPNLREEIKKWKSKGFKLIADMGWWKDIPYIQKKTFKVLEELGFDGVIIGDVTEQHNYDGKLDIMVRPLDISHWEKMGKGLQGVKK